jgi:hypothetical protein
LVTDLFAVVHTNVHHELGAAIGVAESSSNLDQFQPRMLDEASFAVLSESSTSWLGRECGECAGSAYLTSAQITAQISAAGRPEMKLFDSESCIHRCRTVF